MEPVSRDRCSLSPMRFFDGGSCFMCGHHQEIAGKYKLISYFMIHNKYGTIFVDGKACIFFPENNSVRKPVQSCVWRSEKHAVGWTCNLLMAVNHNDVTKAMEAPNDLISELSEDMDFLQVMHVAVILSHLSGIVSQIKKIRVAVENLARLAHFKSPTRRQVGVVIDIDHQLNNWRSRFVTISSLK